MEGLGTPSYEPRSAVLVVKPHLAAGTVEKAGMVLWCQEVCGEESRALAPQASSRVEGFRLTTGGL